MSAGKRLDDIVLGIIGLGGAGSLGFNISSEAERLPFVTQIYLNEKDNFSKLLHFKRHSRYPDKYVVPGDTGDVERVKQDTADNCNVVLLCFDRGMGASKGNMASAPPDIRKRLFDTNIDAVVDYARFFGKKKSDALFVVCTNPTDALSYFFSKEYWAARNEPEQQGNVVGFNHVDTRRYEALVKEALSKVLGVEPDGIYAAMWGPHDARSFPMISQSSYRRGGKRVKLSETGELSTEVMKALAVQSKSLPFIFLKLFGSTAPDTSYAVEDLLYSIRGEKEICNLSYPVPSSGGVVPFMGLPLHFENGRAVLMGNLIEYLSPEEQADYDRAVRSCRDDLEQLLRRQGEVKAYVIRTNPESNIAATPKFFKEIAVPLKTQVNEKYKDGKEGRQDLHHESWLHFLNFTYPFEDFSETRPKVRLAEREFYVEVISVGGKNLVAVSHDCGVQVVDPMTGVSDNYVIEGKHPNGCCTIDDKIIASASGLGIFVAEKAGRGGKLVPLKMFDKKFQGYVKSHDGVLYYSFGESIFSARIGRDGLVERKVGSLPHRIRHFAVHPEAGLLRIFVTCSGGVYRLDMEDGAEKTKPCFVNIYHGARSSGVKSRVNLIGVDYVFDDYYIIVSKDDKLLLLDRNAEEVDSQSEDEPIRRKFDRLGDISSFVCDPFGGIAVASNRYGVELFRVSKSGDKAKSSRIDLPKHDLTDYDVKEGQYAEFRILNAIALYSEFR